jgi:hypothetical protein
MIPVNRIPKHLRADIGEVLQDFQSFCACFFSITDKTGKRVPFLLNPAQIQVAALLATENRIAVPKARQLGVSMVIRAWHCYLLVAETEPKTYATLAHHHRAASHLHEVGRALLRSLPTALKPDMARETQTELTLSADYELMLRLIHYHGIFIDYLPKILVKMRLGGASNHNFSNRLIANKQDRLAWAHNKIKPNALTILLKPLRKLPQWLFPAFISKGFK